MSEHVRYMHVERFGAPDVEGIEVGSGIVFPKLDGTNGSLWYDPTTVRMFAGSRGRVLTDEADNHGFHAWAQDQVSLCNFFRKYPRVRIFGEWLVPHTFKHYRDDAWRRFWIFDVWGEDTQRWVPYEEYAPLLLEAGLDVVTPLMHVINPTQEQLIKIAEGNTFLVQDGAGPGEGVVLKRYDFVNRFGRTTWAKLVRNEFKDKHKLAMGVPEAGEVFQIEVAIAQKYVTPTLVAKERAKIEGAIEAENAAEPSHDQFGQPLIKLTRSKLIPRLLETVYHCVVTEELWPALREHRDPEIDFKKLRRHVVAQTKSLAKDLF